MWMAREKFGKWVVFETFNDLLKWLKTTEWEVWVKKVTEVKQTVQEHDAIWAIMAKEEE